MTRAFTLAALTAVCAVVPASTQTQGRLATTPGALRASPVFYHGKQVAVLGSLLETRDLYRLEPRAAGGSPADASTAPPDLASKPVYVYWRERPTRSDGEIRGEFWDLGRLAEGDSRFTATDFKPLLEYLNQGRWPARDQVFVIANASIVEAIEPSTPTLRAVVLDPERYADRSATVSGRFRGRNLLGDIANPLPTPGKWDFVVRSADAALWVSGLRPRGRDFELDPGARVDTGRWVQVTGTVRRDGSRAWLEAREIELAKPVEDAVEVVVPATPAEPPPAVIFSTPVPDEVDVEPRALVRVQFSRDMDAVSFKGRVRVSYPMPDGATAGPAVPAFGINYNVGTRALEVKFSAPFERFQQVRIELLEGIAAVGGVNPLTPWSLTFTTGR